MENFDNENIICESCGSDNGECESFTHRDDNGDESEYVICLTCWDELQDKIVVGKQNDFKLKDGCELVLRAYNSVQQVNKYIKVKNNTKTKAPVEKVDECCPKCNHKLV